MQYLTILLLTIFIGAFVSFKILKTKLTSPLSLHSLSWMVVVICGMILNDYFIPLPDISFYLLLTWYLTVYLILSFGETLCSLYGFNENKYNENYSCMKYRYFLVPAIILTALEIYRVGNGGDAGFLLNLRSASTVSDYSGPTPVFMSMLYPVMAAIFAISCLCGRKNRPEFVLSLLWMLLYAFGTMGKFAIVTPIIIYCVVREGMGLLNKRKLLIAAPAAFLTLIFLHFSRMADGDQSSLISVIGTYIYSPLVALSSLDNVASNGSMDFTMRFFYAIAYKIGLSPVAPVETILPYVEVPFPTNVYTVMQPFFQDLSFIGVIFGALFYGIVFSLIYGAARKGNMAGLLAYSLIAISMLTTFFAETLVMNFSGNLKLIACAVLLWKFTVRTERTPRQ